MKKPKGIRPSEQDRERLQDFIEEAGLREASAALCMATETIARAAAGIRVNPSTLELIRMKLDEADATALR